MQCFSMDCRGQGNVLGRVPGSANLASCGAYHTQSVKLKSKYIRYHIYLWYLISKMQILLVIPT